MATLLRLPITGGEPDPKFVQTNKASGPLDAAFDIRDYLNHAVAGNYKGVSDQDIKNSYMGLADKLGQPLAQKLLSHAFLFNQSNVQGAPEDRIKKFYEMGANDPAIAKILMQAKGLGYGSKEGALTSHYRGVIDEVPANQKILLRVAKK